MSGASIDLELRPMASRDLEEITQLELELFTEPWPRAVFSREIRDVMHSWSVVALRGERLVAYAVAWHVGSEFHIANIAVRREDQRLGIGGWLVDAALEEGGRLGCRHATLEVRMSNRAAISLYENRNFRRIAIRKGYYVDNGEDALVMVRDIAGSEEHGGLVQKEEQRVRRSR